MRRRTDRDLFRVWFRDRRSAIVACVLAGVFVLSIGIPSLSAKEEPKPELQEWQMNGIVAALDDQYSLVKRRAFEKLVEFDTNDLKAFSRQSEKIEKEAIEVLANKNENSYFRISAAEALRKLGRTNSIAIQVLSDIASDGKQDILLRATASKVLRKQGKPSANGVQMPIDEIRNSQRIPDIGANSSEALGKHSNKNGNAIQILSDTLRNNRENPFLVINSVEELGSFRQLILSEVFILINLTHAAENNHLDYMRFASYFYSRGDAEVKTLLRWIGRPKPDSVPTALTHNEAKKALEVFAKAWEPSREFSQSRAELAEAIANVAKMVQWQTSDISLLEKHYKSLSDAKLNSADSVKSAIDSLTFWKYFNQFRNIIAAHLVFWVALIFFYPKHTWIQAIFFWNPWVRKIGGAGYVGFLLAWIPFLRQKLFEPFKPSLLADARLSNFDPDAYFPESNVTLVGSRHSSPLNTTLPAIQGQIILEGSSGLGKSMFLRHLVKRSSRIVVYLPARKCENGVIEAIQAKLHGQAQDAEFLKNLIYSGAIDICIDGLNEVSADTRAKISQFVESYFKGNIILTTQPIEWIAPTTAKIYELQPLAIDQIETFLLSRSSIVAPTSTADYVQSCRDYLSQSLDPHQFPEELAATQRILSNPMDLTIVAQMIALRKTPNLFRLQEQQYQLMAEEYRDRWNQTFPMKKFSEALYQLRLNDEKAIPADEFLHELQSMEDEKYKMVVSRQWKDPQGEPKQEWYCRHDKIMEFFIVQTFLGDTETAQNRLLDHMGDSRFRGVYFLLATLLPLDRASDLREKLILYAAESKDHTVSDTFVQLFHSRTTLEQTAEILSSHSN